MTEAIDAIPSGRQQKFHDEYWDHFSLVEAVSEEDRRACFRLRNQVYRDGAGGADAVERDAFDDAGLHFMLIHNATGGVAGTCRLLLPGTSGPEGCISSTTVAERLQGSRQDVGEISRLCMAERFRRRAGDGPVLPAYSEQEINGDLMPLARALVGRRVTYAPLGLLMGAFRAALARRCVNVVALFDPGDLRSLRRIGLAHKPLGPKLEAYGPHQPVLINIPLALDMMEAVNPECWEIVSDRGAILAAGYAAEPSSPGAAARSES